MIERPTFDSPPETLKINMTSSSRGRRRRCSDASDLLALQGRVRGCGLRGLERSDRPAANFRVSPPEAHRSADQ